MYQLQKNFSVMRQRSCVEASASSQMHGNNSGTQLVPRTFTSPRIAAHWSSVPAPCMGAWSIGWRGWRGSLLGSWSESWPAHCLPPSPLWAEVWPRAV